MDLEDVPWSQLTSRLTNGGLERVHRTFATHRDLPRRTRSGGSKVSDLPPEILRRFHGDPSARGLMWFCIVSCASIFVAWNWSLGRLPHQLDNRGHPKPRSREQISLYDKLADNFMIKREALKAGRWWTMVTASFSHIETSHLIGNLFAFYTFSSMAIMGGLTALPYGVLILGSTISSHLAFLYQDSQRQRKRDVPIESRALGLSGVVMGVGAAVSFAMPTAKILMMGIVPVPMWAVMIGYMVYDSTRLNDETSRTGHAAHLGGALFGTLFYFMKIRRGGR